MLRTIHTMEELDISGWMEVYREGHEGKRSVLLPGRAAGAGTAPGRGGLPAVFGGLFQIPGAQYWIWEEEGRYVSCLRLKPDRDGLLLEALETRPDCRRKDLANN